MRTQPTITQLRNSGGGKPNKGVGARKTPKACAGSSSCIVKYAILSFVDKSLSVIWSLTSLVSVDIDYSTHFNFFFCYMVFEDS